MAIRIQNRRGTASQWLSVNNGDGPVLAGGEIGFESDTGKFKIGDGVNHWVDLSYFVDADALIDGAPGLLDTLNEIAAAINDDPTFFTTVATNLSNHESDTTNIHGITDTAELATKTFAAELLTNATKSNITITGDKNGLTITAENGVADSNTDNLSEGSTNKYFTDERAQDAVGNNIGTGLTYTDSTGAISVTANTYDAYGSASAVAGDLSTHTGSTEAHGATGAVVGTTNSQTLTNKTLTSPKINEDVALTATATELNVLDGITSSTAELNILDGVTATASEINTLDGITASTAELNILDGVTSDYTELNILDGATLSTTELNYVDGVTSGIQDQLDDKAPLASPTFTGTITTGDLVINGDVTVNSGEFLASATSITIEDNLIQLAHQNVANTVDLGIVVGYNESSTAKHSGVVRDVSANRWKIFKGVLTEPSTTVDFSEGSLDDLEVANLIGNVTGDVSGNAGTVTNGIYTSGSYSDPSWITGLAWSKISSTPTTLSGYGITDGLTSSTAASTYAPINSPTFTGTVSGITKSMVDLGNVENTALSTWAGSSNITTLGTVSTGTWSADTIAINKGGTGQTTAMAAATALLPSQTSNSGKYLTNDGAGTLSWATVSGYSAPTLGSTSIASGATVTTIAGLTLSSGTATTAFTLNGTAELRLADTDSTHYVGFKSPATVSTNRIWTLPAADGATGQVLSTNGSGTLSWATAGGGGAAFSELMLIGA